MTERIIVEDFQQISEGIDKINVENGRVVLRMKTATIVKASVDSEWLSSITADQLAASFAVALMDHAKKLDEKMLG